MPNSIQPDYIALDIGGANIKSASLFINSKREISISCKKHIFPMWKKADQLKYFLEGYSEHLPVKSIAVVITAELSDIFKSKREGIDYIVSVLEEAFQDQDILIYSVPGTFISPSLAYRRPLDVAGANWAASAAAASHFTTEGIFIDIGSTTADIIPFKHNKILTLGRTDPERLASGELVYTGVLRTPVNHLAKTVPFQGSFCRVSSEYFAITADVHVILGNIKPKSYNWPTPDNRGTDISCAASRLARVICADSEMLSENDIKQIAYYFYDKQIQQLTEALHQILSRFANPLPLIAAGEGIFLAKAAGTRLGLEIIDLSSLLGEECCSNFTVWSLSLLLAEFKEGEQILDRYIKDSCKNRW